MVGNIYTTGNHNVHIADYVAGLKAIACKEYPAPTCFSEHHDSMNYHIFTAKNKSFKPRG